MIVLKIDICILIRIASGYLPIQYLIFVATYSSTGRRREAHGCIFHGRKMCGVSTNVYLRKTLEKPKVSLRTLSMKGSGVVFTHGEGISTPCVRHKERRPLIECANHDFKIMYFLFSFLCIFLPSMFFLLFCGRQECFPRFYIFLNCDEEIRPMQFFKN